jgi:uncharacterized protein YqeY
MAELRSQLTTNLKEALRGRQEVAVSTIRLLLAAIKNAEIAAMHPLSLLEEQAVLVAQIKQRHDSIEQFRNAHREDLAVKEEAELAVLDAYLPPAPSADEVASAIAAAIADLGATGPQDMSRVMRQVLDRYPGRVDGKQVAPLVRQALTRRS